jgi:hypothetical protein
VIERLSNAMTLFEILFLLITLQSISADILPMGTSIFPLNSKYIDTRKLPNELKLNSEIYTPESMLIITYCQPHDLDFNPLIYAIRGGDYYELETYKSVTKEECTDLYIEVRIPPGYYYIVLSIYEITPNELQLDELTGVLVSKRIQVVPSAIGPSVYQKVAEESQCGGFCYFDVYLLENGLVGATPAIITKNFKRLRSLISRDLLSKKKETNQQSSHP